MWRPSLLLALALLVILGGCTADTEQPLSQAFVAPASINLRSQLGQKSGTVSVLKHGERVTIVDVRRRFVKVRTQKGAEGWMDAFDLLYEEGAERPSMLAINLHDRLIGRPARAVGLIKFLEYARAHDRVWFCTGRRMLSARP